MMDKAKIAILTGASSGLGREFALRIRDAFPQITEIWLVARRADRLEELSERIGFGARTICADLSCEEGLSRLRNLLEAETPEVMLLINNAGCGYLGALETANSVEQETMIRVNILALTLVTKMALSYMPNGARILNVSSIASFVPTANMAVYSSTKAYVSSFGRALGEELRPRNIRVTAVCPGPMATEFVKVGRIEGKSKAFQVLPYCDAGIVARNALIACAKGKPIYTPRAFYKLYRALSKLLPTRWLLRFTRT